MDLRHLKAIKNITNLVEFGGDMSKAIRAAGFSEAMAHTPKKITDSKWFKSAIPDYTENVELVRDETKAAKMEHYVFPLMMTDDEIVETIKDTLPGARVTKIKRNDTQVWAYFSAPDHDARQKILDKIFKIRGDYAAVKISTVDPYEGMTDEQLDEELAKAKQERDERLGAHG